MSARHRPIGTECNNCRNRLWKIHQCFFRLIDVINPLGTRVSSEYAPIEHLRFSHMLGLNQQCSGPECAGSSKGFWIYRNARWLISYMLS